MVIETRQTGLAALHAATLCKTANALRSETSAGKAAISAATIG
jgi:hypothetical protein